MSNCDLKPIIEIEHHKDKKFKALDQAYSFHKELIDELKVKLGEFNLGASLEERNQWVGSIETILHHHEQKLLPVNSQIEESELDIRVCKIQHKIRVKRQFGPAEKQLDASLD